MKPYKILLFSLTVFTLTNNYIYTADQVTSKIVGLVPARNEQVTIEQCLRALAKYTDAIIVLDDASFDDTVEIVESLIEECNIEKIIKKTVWYRDEAGDYNRLLQAGRAIGGTHFIRIDADEMFTANFMHDNYLRKLILQLKPGERLTFSMMRIWKSLDNYLEDLEAITPIFCDDGISFHASKSLNHGTARVPKNLTGTKFMVSDHENYGLMHFQAVNWRNMKVRNYWYKCIEHTRRTGSVDRINEVYHFYEKNPCPLLTSNPEWFKYDFFDRLVFDAPEVGREQQVLKWFEQYGRDHFAGLHIWDLDWGAALK